MKKNLVSFMIVVFSSFAFLISSVQAKKFKEIDRYTGYYFKITEKEGSFFSSQKTMKILDDENKGYFAINPRSVFYYSKEYELQDIDVDKEIMQEISKVLYYGYGYQNQTTDAYYFATQYLVYEAFKDYNVVLTNNYSVPVNAYSEEIKQIKKNIEENAFSYPALSTKKDTIEIEDAYILKHFTITGEHLEVSEEENKMTIILLDDLEDYTLSFIPKLDCTTLKMWQNEDLKYIHMDTICENPYTSTIHFERPVEEQQPEQEKEEPKTPEENESKKEESIETEDKEKKPEEPIDTDSVETEKDEKEEAVEEEMLQEILPVPSTSKDSFAFLIVLAFLGFSYYVFKK